jgi:hypothetical protein
LLCCASQENGVRYLQWVIRVRGNPVSDLVDVRDPTYRERRPRAGIERHPPQDAKARRFLPNFNNLDLSSHLPPILLLASGDRLSRQDPFDIPSDRQEMLRPPV